jgi:hypothetical protein
MNESLDQNAIQQERLEASQHNAKAEAAIKATIHSEATQRAEAQNPREQNLGQLAVVGNLSNSNISARQAAKAEAFFNRAAA